MVYFRNVKTNVETKKSIYNLSLIKNMGKIYNIYDLYKEFIKMKYRRIHIFSYNPSSQVHQCILIYNKHKIITKGEL